jgi:two-component system, NtrC family, nitrogen regulation response regulator GlnG
VELELGAEAAMSLPESLAAINSQGMRTPEPERRQTLASAMACYLSELFHARDGCLPPSGLYRRILREIEYPLISAALAATGFNQIKAAELLGLNRNTLRKKVRTLDIKRVVQRQRL